MNVSISSPPRMMSASENRRSSLPYADVPMTPPMATAVVSSPKPTALIPRRSLAYSTSTDQAAPYVTLKAMIVRASVRIGGCARSQRMPSAISVRRLPRSADSLSGEVRNVRRDASDQHRAERETGRVGRERQTPSRP